MNGRTYKRPLDIQGVQACIRLTSHRSRLMQSSIWMCKDFNPCSPMKAEVSSIHDLSWISVLEARVQGVDSTRTWLQCLI